MKNLFEVQGEWTIIELWGNQDNLFVSSLSLSLSPSPFSLPPSLSLWSPALFLFKHLTIFLRWANTIQLISSCFFLTFIIYLYK